MAPARGRERPDERRCRACVVRGVDLVNRRGKSVGVRLVKLTGKRPYAIHPKHLVDQPLARLVPAVPVGRRDRVLDVGCSNGAHLLRAAPRAARSSASTTTCAQLAIADREHRASSGSATPACFAWDITRPFPFADRDLRRRSLFLDVIEHWSRAWRCCARSTGVLKDDGRLLVSAPNRETRWRRTLRAAGLFAYSDPDHKIEYTARGVPRRAARRAASSRKARLMPVVLDTPWAGVIDAVGGVSLAAL